MITTIKRATKFKSLKNNIIAKALMLLTLLYSSFSFSATEYYVDVLCGNDANVGTEALPFKTITAAKNKIKLINTTMSDDIIVYLRDGRHELDATLNFDSSDSGSNGYTITYRNYPGESPSISGGKVITGWTYDPAIDIDNTANNLTVSGFYTDIPGSYKFRQLYVDGEPAIRARTPTHDWRNATKGQWDSFVEAPAGTAKKPENYDILSRIPAFHLAKDNDGITGEDNEISQLLAMSANDVARVEYVQLANWRQHRTQLSYAGAHDSDTTKISVGVPDDSRQVNFASGIACCGGQTFLEAAQISSAYRLENALSFMDDQREWFFDYDTRRLYYLPDASEVSNNTLNATVIMPVLDKLITLNGASNITFYGLTLEHANYLYPDTYGLSQRMAGLYNDIGHPGWDGVGEQPVHDGGIEIEQSENIIFERNRIQNFGANGMVLLKGVKRLGIKENIFQNNGVSHFVAYGNASRNPSNAYQLEDIALQQNYMIEPGFAEQMGMSIFGLFTKRMYVENNEISGSDHYGINIGWGALTTGKMPALANNSVRFNDFSQLMRFSQDTAVIHTKSATDEGVTHTRIEENFVHDITNTQWHDEGFGHNEKRIFYLDDRSNRVTVLNNVIKNTPAIQKITHLQGERLGLAENNIIDLNFDIDNDLYVSSTDGTESGTVTVPNLSTEHLASAESVMLNAGIEPTNKIIKTFIKSGVLGTGNPTSTDSGLVANWNFNGAQNDKVTYEDLSPMAHHLSANNTTRTAYSISGYRNLYLNNTEDKSIAIGFKGIEGQTPRTISAWIKTSEADGTIISWGNDTPGGKWVFGLKDSKLQLDIGNAHLISNDSLNGQWHHVAVSFDSKLGADITNAILYVDGVRQLTTSVEGIVGTGADQDVQIGASSLATDHFSNAKVDNIKLYRRALGQQEISYLFDERSVEASWIFDQNGSDRSDYANSLTLVGGAAYSTNSFKEASASLSLTTNNAAAQAINYHGVTGTKPRSVTAWIKTTDNNAVIVSWGSNNPGKKFSFAIDAIGNSADGVLSLGTNGAYIKGTKVITDGNWHQVSLTWANDGTPDIEDARFFVDGVPDPISVTLNGEVNTADSYDVVIGDEAWTSSDDRGYIGKIDAVRIFSRALNPREIYNMYHNR